MNTVMETNARSNKECVYDLAKLGRKIDVVDLIKEIISDPVSILKMF